jgi:hypothetical protein
MGMTPFRVQAVGNAVEYQQRAKKWAAMAMEEKALVLGYQILAAQSAQAARRAMGLVEGPWA